ncbi:MAG TPA: hypothetical protein VFA15_02995, partial [Nitrososphaera sp.]|nr:hypothetical protein [Nitrososphaera sp.]
MLLLTAFAFVWTVQAEDPKKQAPKKEETAVREDAVVQQERLAKQYAAFEQILLRMAQRLERSNKPEDREKAVVLKEAIRKAGDVGLSLRFERLIATLRAPNGVRLQEITEAMNQSQLLADDMRAILALLRNDNRDEQLKNEKERIRKLIEMLDKVTREQKVVRAQNEAGRTDKDALSKAQQKVTEATKDVAKAMGKDGKQKDGRDDQAKGKDKDGKDKDGKDKSDQAKGKDGKDKDTQAKGK